METNKLLRAVILCYGCLWPFTPACSALFGINPTKIRFADPKSNRAPHDKQVETITIKNEQDIPTVVHLKVMEWMQKDGKNVYVDTKDVVALPNIVKIKPKGIQIIRVVLDTMPHPTVEKTYRLYINELPAKNASQSSQEHGLNFLMCIGVPVFVDAMKPFHPKAKASLVWHGKDLHIHNKGDKHIHINKVQHYPHQKKASSIFQYVLPNQKMPLKLESNNVAKGTKVITHIEDEVLHLSVPHNNNDEVSGLNVSSKP